MYVGQRSKIQKMELVWYEQKLNFCMDLVTDFQENSFV